MPTVGTMTTASPNRTIVMLTMVDAGNPNPVSSFGRSWYMFDIPKELLLFESARLNTFGEQPSEHHPSSQDLAEVGMFLDRRHMNRTICRFCLHCFYNWRSSDYPYQVHLLANPYCPLLTDPTNAGNVPITGGLVDWEREMYLPTRVSKSTLGRPYKFANQPGTVHRMLNAGLVPTGFGDEVYCLDCHLQLHRWPENINYSPVIAHVIMSESCRFIQSTFTPIQIGRYRSAAHAMVRIVNRNHSPIECGICGMVSVQRVHFTKCGHDACFACGMTTIQCHVCNRKIFMRVFSALPSSERPYGHFSLLAG